MSTYNKVARLELTIKALTLEPLQQAVPGGFTRHTTIIQLKGDGTVGAGEDVTYDTDDQLDFQKRGGSLPLSGTYTIDSFSRHLESLTLFQALPKQEASRNYLRWAFESAALSLAYGRLTPH